MEDLPTRLEPSTDPTNESSGEVPPTASRLGRYVVIEELGRGGMGVVLRAYDPRLQREVALKMLLGHAVSAAARTRMVREARAMAKLSHPNVVAVYDVETEGDDVMLAMELVEGQPLSRWLRAEPEPAQILSVFAGAGRGLAAAHAVGLLHRDFKPANVIVRDDGRAQVTDFGLARATGSATTDGGDAPAPTGTAEDASVDTPLTQAGTVVGTPAYMAPECHLDEVLDPVVDQYAFCVALWQALTGALPFTGSFEAMWKAKMKGAPPWPTTVAVPGAVVSAIRRGLSPEPLDRFASMEPLLAALTPPKGRRDRVWALMGMGMVVIGAVTALTATVTRSISDPCSGAEDAMAPVWNETSKQTVQASLKALDRPHATGVARWVDGQLDGWAQAWIDGHREACEATTVRGEQSEAAMDLRMACLGRTQRELGTVVGMLSHADVGVLDGAERLVSQMASPDRCADVAGLQAGARAPSDPRVAEQVAQVRDALAQVEALRLVARLDEAHEQLVAIRQSMEGIAYPALRTEVLLVEGRLEDDRGNLDRAEELLREAMREGLRWSQWHEAWKASNALVMLDSEGRGRPELALAYHDTSLGLLAQVGTDGVPDAATRTNFGLLLVRLGRLTEAEVEQRAALALYTKARPADHPDLARVRTHLAVALQAQGRYDEATAELTEARRIWEAAMSPDHPEAWSTVSDLGLVHKAQGRLEEAEAAFREVIAAWERTLGPDHIRLTTPWLNLANTLRAQGRVDEAEAAVRRSLTLSRADQADAHPSAAVAQASLALILKAKGDNEAAQAQMQAALTTTEATLGREHPQALNFRSNLANIHKNLGRLDEAESEMRAVLAAERNAFGSDHPKAAATLHNLANIIGLRGRAEESARLFAQAAQLRRERLGPDHRLLASSLAGWGHGLLEQQEPRKALVPLREAWGILERAEANDLERARLAFPLARALWDSEEDRDEARTLATSALTWSEASRGADHPATVEIREWIAEHR